MAFRDEAKVNGINLFLYFTRVQGVLVELDDMEAHSVPIFLEKERVDVIKARGFSGFKREHNLLDFLGIGDGVKERVILRIK